MKVSISHNEIHSEQRLTNAISYITLYGTPSCFYSEQRAFPQLEHHGSRQATLNPQDGCSLLLDVLLNELEGSPSRSQTDSEGSAHAVVCTHTHIYVYIYMHIYIDWAIVA